MVPSQAAGPDRWPEVGGCIGENPDLSQAPWHWLRPRQEAYTRSTVVTAACQLLRRRIPHASGFDVSPCSLRQKRETSYGRASVASMSNELIAQRQRRVQAEIQRLRTLFAAQPSVHQVVIFGSTASGQTHVWSDLDVMVIETSEVPFIERSVRLARLVKPQVGTQFLVYTPEEMVLLAQQPFMRIEILGKGKVLPMQPHLEAQRWLTFAEQDRRMAELALGAAIFNQTCFHAQQCVGKCLKACLTAGGALVPRTHLIADLVQQMPAAAQSVMAAVEDDLLALDQFYIPTRYPDALPGVLPDGLPQRAHADLALATAQQCYGQTAQWLAGLPGQE